MSLKNMDAQASFWIRTLRLASRSYKQYGLDPKSSSKTYLSFFHSTVLRDGEGMVLYHFWVCSSRNLIWFLKSLERDKKRLTVCLTFQAWEEVLLLLLFHLYFPFFPPTLPRIFLLPSFLFFLPTFQNMPKVPVRCQILFWKVVFWKMNQPQSPLSNSSRSSLLEF